MKNSPDAHAREVPAAKVLDTALSAAAKAVERELERLLPEPHGEHARLHEAMRYAIFAGGKRMRPFLVLTSARLFSVPQERALRTAAAIETIHTYSLVHDDLPAWTMTNSVGAGRPSMLLSMR